MDEPIEVTVKRLDNGTDATGWYAWETECPEEGCFWVSEHRPTPEDLKALHPMYVEGN